jgi:hypothetical protein
MEHAPNSMHVKMMITQPSTQVLLGKNIRYHGAKASSGIRRISFFIYKEWFMRSILNILRKMKE